MLKRVEDTLLGLSVEKKDSKIAKREWKLSGGIECDESGINSEWECEACGKQGLKRRGKICNLENQNMLWVGLECALYFEVITKKGEWHELWKRQQAEETLDLLVAKNNQKEISFLGKSFSRYKGDSKVRTLIGNKLEPKVILYIATRLAEEEIYFPVAAFRFWAKSTIVKIKKGSCETLEMSELEFDLIKACYSFEMITARQEALMRKKSNQEEQANREKQKEKALALQIEEAEKREAEAEAKRQQLAIEQAEWENKQNPTTASKLNIEEIKFQPAYVYRKPPQKKPNNLTEHKLLIDTTKEENADWLAKQKQAAANLDEENGLGIYEKSINAKYTQEDEGYGEENYDISDDYNDDYNDDYDDDDE